MPGQSPHLNEQQFRVKITPAQSNLLSSYRGASEHLDAAEDHGASWTSNSLTVPHEAAPHIASFVSMHAEIARDVQGDYMTPGERAKHRTALGLHKNVSAALGEHMRGR